MLTFNEKEHKYYYGGGQLPSVTQIIKSITTHFYNENIPKYVLEKAQERGTLIHGYIENFLLWGIIRVEEYDYIEYFENFLKWHNEYKPKVLEVEKMLTNGEYAGTVDLICEINGETWLIDHKTSKELHTNFVEVQEYGYKNLCENNGIRIDKCGVLFLSKDNYFFKEIQPNKEMWDTCMKCYKFSKGE